MSEAIRSAREAMEAFTAEAFIGAVKMPREQAEEFASAWRDLARALGEPMGAVELANSSERAREIGIQLFEKVMLSVSPLANTTSEDRLEGFPGRKVAAERAARGMGFDAEDRDTLWELGFNLVMCELPAQRRQHDFCFMCKDLNKAHRFSESIEWALAEREAWNGAQMASNLESNARRLINAADGCRGALEGLAQVCEARHNPEGPRAWLGDREVRIMKAMMAIVSLSARIQWVAPEEGRVIQDRAQAFAVKGEALGRMIEASARANDEKRKELESESVANVKKRRIG